MTKAWFSSFSEPRPYWRDCIILSLAVGATAVTFGVFADAAGFDLPRIVVMSALVFTGASQFAAVGVIDETTAMTVAQTDRRNASGAFWFTGITLWLCWNAGSVAGALLGAVLGAPETWGLDAAFPAIFIALLATHVRTAAGRTAALAAAAVAVGVVPFTGAGVPILMSVLAVAPALYVRARLQRAARGGDQENEPEAAL